MIIHLKQSQTLDWSANQVNTTRHETKGAGTYILGGITWRVGVDTGCGRWMGSIGISLSSLARAINKRDKECDECEQQYSHVNDVEDSLYSYTTPRECRIIACLKIRQLLP